MNKFLYGLVALLALGLPGMSWATPSNDNCTGFITSLPATISTPGTWCMTHGLSTEITNGYAITIDSDNVTIDCNGFSIENGPPNPATFAYAIYGADLRHTTVRKCRIAGFNIGVNITEGNRGISPGHVVEDNFFDGNYYLAVALEGDGAVVQRNQVLNTGGSLYYRDGVAISVSGTADIVDNSIRSKYAGANGIASGSNAGGNVSNNRVSNVSSDGANAVFAISIQDDPNQPVRGNPGFPVVRNNFVSGSDTTESLGITCDNPAARAENNVIGGFFWAFTGCGDAGGNDVMQ